MRKERGGGGGWVWFFGVLFLNDTVSNWFRPQDARDARDVGDVHDSMYITTWKY